MIRTVLITSCYRGNERKTFYGRYDPVTLERQGWKIEATMTKKFKMSDADFVRYGTEVETILKEEK